MSTIRVSRRDRFTVIDRQTAEDDRLSFKARGVLLWLLSKPNDWRCTSADIAQAGKEGRDAVRSALRELEAVGYITRTKVQDPETGKWSTETVVSEKPQVTGSADRETPGRTEDGIPGVGNPDVGYPDVGFPGAIENTQTEDPPTPQDPEWVEVEEDEQPPLDHRAQIGHRLAKRYGEPNTPGQDKIRQSQITKLMDLTNDPVEVSRRAEMLKVKWPTCDNPIAMLIQRWDDWATPTPGQMYGV